MNKTKKLFSITVAALFAISLFTSCMKTGGQHYSAVNEYAYITTTKNGTVYARMASGYLITAPEIANKKPGRSALISFTIDSESEKITVDENFIIHKAVLSSDPVILDEAHMFFTDAPKEESPVKFSNILFPPNNYDFSFFGNNWPFTYDLKLKKGETPILRFYVAQKDEDDQSYTSQDIIIDIRAEKTGTPAADAQESVERFNVVCNFTELRRSIPNLVKDSSQKTVTLRFRFYRDNDEKPAVSEQFKLNVLEENQ